MVIGDLCGGDYAGDAEYESVPPREFIAEGFFAAGGERIKACAAVVV